MLAIFAGELRGNYKCGRAEGVGGRWISKVARMLPLEMRSETVNALFLPILESLSLS